MSDNNLPVPPQRHNSNKYLDKHEVKEWFTERGFFIGLQWLYRREGKEIPRYRIGRQVRWLEKDLEAYLETRRKEGKGKSGRNGHKSPKRIQKGIKTALTGEQIEEILKEVGEPWNNTLLIQAFKEFQSFKMQAGHPWKFPQGIKATCTKFKDKEFTFPNAVAHAIAYEWRGVFPVASATPIDDGTPKPLTPREIELAKKELGL